MGKFERKYLAHYIDSNMGEGVPEYVRLGKDLEAYSEELNPQVNIQRNLCGSPNVVFDGYQVQSNVENYYAEQGDVLFAVLSHIANNRLTDETCKTTKVDVLVDGSGNQIWAYREECWMIPVSVGGDTSGVQIPFNVYCSGNRKYGVFDTATKTFTVSGEPDPPFPFIPLSVSQNGVYTAPSGKGYSPVVVDVVNGSGGHEDDIVTRALSGTYTNSTASVVGLSAFANCYKLNEVEMTACSRLSDGAFFDCRMLSKVNMPSCTSVGVRAFQSCRRLSVVSLASDSAVRIGKYAFDGCSSLSSFYAPKCEYIYDYAFQSCSLLRVMPFPEVKSIQSWAFAYAGLYSVSLSKCWALAAGAFSACRNLSIVDLKICSYIGSSAFAGCSGLTSIFLLSSTGCKLANSNAFTNSNWRVYVPSSLYYDYVESGHTNTGEWWHFASNIVGVDPEDPYPSDTFTITFTETSENPFSWLQDADRVWKADQLPADISYAAYTAEKTIYADLSNDGYGVYNLSDEISEDMWENGYAECDIDVSDGRIHFGQDSGQEAETGGYTLYALHFSE